MRLDWVLRRGVLIAAVAALMLGVGPRKTSAAAAQAAAKVDLNSATATELERLPGIGSATAKKIIAGRPYKAVDDLAKAGISAKEIAKITPLVTVSPVAAETAPTKPAKPGKPVPAAAELVDLNSATVAELEKLPGIGPASAKKIMAARPYKSIDELTKAGISAKEIAKITSLVTVGTTATPRTVGKPVVPDTNAPPEKGMVWVNLDSKKYHKEGSRWYGKTKNGKYMSEADAIKDGFIAAKN